VRATGQFAASTVGIDEAENNDRLQKLEEELDALKHEVAELRGLIENLLPLRLE